MLKLSKNNLKQLAERLRLNKRGRAAFTLAEILITLGIIGVVAALVMPSLIASYREKAAVVKLKKFYSVISQAYQSAIFDNGSPDGWNLIASADGQGAENMFNILSRYLNVSKRCGNNPGCFSSYPFVDYTYSYSKAVLADGSQIAIYIRDPDCKANVGTTSSLSNTCASIRYSVGQYRFEFWLTKDRVVPIGSPEEGYVPFETGCIKSAPDSSCTAWTLYNENMNYMHCTGLSWNGKTKCD